MQNDHSRHTALLTLVVPSQPSMAPVVDALVTALTTGLEFDNGMRDDVVIAVNEAVHNAIYHGNRCDSRKPIQLVFRCHPSALTVWVKDQGQGFNPAALPNPRSPENLLQEHGRGILLMKALMDEVDFQSTGERGMTIKLVKRREVNRLKVGG